MPTHSDLLEFGYIPFDSLLIQNASNNLGSVILQGEFNPGSTDQLISGIYVNGNASPFFDITGGGSGSFNISLTIIPIPASVWLFGSGLIGLIGVISRRDRSH